MLTTSQPFEPSGAVAEAGTAAASGSAIRIEGLSKRFSDTSEDYAVKDVDLDIPSGEIVMLVGPSGCGKTTVLKMINRLIEPTSGSIYIDGEDVVRADVDTLRRRIGYVMQSSGLFPHHTIARNIATVPGLLGWPQARIDSRIDELLATMGLAGMGDRHPRELSGGQAQRVAVARAMAAGPSVMLMDEPFGALDRLTREHLQDEFLRLQETTPRTIVFVTHDIDEALRMGDRIAILGTGFALHQYDTPERILREPADDAVASLVGGGRMVRLLGLSALAEVDAGAGLDYPSAGPADDPGAVTAGMDRTGQDWSLLLDADGRPRCWASREMVAGAASLDQVTGTPVAVTLRRDASILDALDTLLIGEVEQCVVVDGEGRFQRVVGLDGIRAALHHSPGDGSGVPAARGAPTDGASPEPAVGAEGGPAWP
ncbi:MAG: ABC transporter ATP-binding protein [Acidimicrobiales bacterium]